MQLTKKRTLIILDWDDTLFPTSWVVNKKLDLTDPSVRSNFNIYFTLIILNTNIYLVYLYTALYYVMVPDPSHLQSFRFSQKQKFFEHIFLTV